MKTFAHKDVTHGQLMWLTTARRLSTYNIDDSVAMSTASSYYCRCAQQL